MLKNMETCRQLEYIDIEDTNSNKNRQNFV